MNNTLFHQFTVLHYFGEFTAIGKKKVHEATDSILVKEGRVEITYLFKPSCILSQLFF